MTPVSGTKVLVHWCPDSPRPERAPDGRWATDGGKKIMANATDVAAAFAAAGKAAAGNHTAAVDVYDRSIYLLHGSVIASWDREKQTVWLSHAGYPTPTTLKALNGVLRAMPWLKFGIKASRQHGWTLEQFDGAASRSITDRGVTLARRSVNGVASWEFSDVPTDGSLAPALGGAN